MGWSRYAKWAVLVLAVLILAAEGYFGYRWYQRYHASTVEAEASSDRGVPAEAAREPQAAGDVGDALVHRATAGNTVDNSTYMDHPSSNGNPDAIVLVTQAQDPDGTPANAHPIGVWYDENRGGRWAIFNQDLAPMPENAIFSVVILEKPGGSTFVHRVTPSNTEGENTYLSHPSADANPDAVLLVTPTWNPGGGAGTYNSHPVGVRYDAAESRWTVRNEDLAPIPDRAAFEVSVQNSGAG